MGALVFLASAAEEIELARSLVRNRRSITADYRTLRTIFPW